MALSGTAAGSVRKSLRGLPIGRVLPQAFELIHHGLGKALGSRQTRTKSFNILRDQFLFSV